jgi:hypothetical protein
MAIDEQSAKERQRDYGREYRKRPDVVAKRRARSQSAEAKERHRLYLREYNQRPDVKEKNRLARQRPEYVEHHRQYNRAYYQRPEIKAKERTRLYGVTKEQYERMLAEQQGKCSVCLRDLVMTRPDPESKATSWRGQPHVDHDHQTGCVRQLLCRECNVGLGTFQDDVATLRNAIAYLEKHRKLEG